ASRTRDAGAENGGDDSRLGVNPPNAMVARVGEEQVPRCIEGQSPRRCGRLPPRKGQASLEGRSLVAGVLAHTGSLAGAGVVRLPASELVGPRTRRRVLAIGAGRRDALTHGAGDHAIGVDLPDDLVGLVDDEEVS